MGRMPMGRAFVAVLWSFLGIRKESEYQKDTARISVSQILIAAVLGFALFIALLLGLVYLVTH
jgi:hypothetical protein